MKAMTTTSPEALQRSIAALEYVYDHSKDLVQRKRVAQAILRLKGAHGPGNAYDAACRARATAFGPGNRMP